MIDAFPDKPSSRILLHAPFLGLIDCWRCDECPYAILHEIRCSYQPELKYAYYEYEWMPTETIRAEIDLFGRHPAI